MYKLLLILFQSLVQYILIQKILHTLHIGPNTYKVSIRIWLGHYIPL